MELESKQPSIQQSKPQNMLLLQQSILQSRIFPVYSFDDALQSTFFHKKEMIKIYGQAMALTNSDNPQIKDTVRFSLKSMTDYYSSMENIMYMERDNSSNTNQKDKHKKQLQSYDKEFLLASLKNYCVKKSAQKSIELAKLIYKNGENVEEVLRNIGFA